MQNMLIIISFITLIFSIPLNFIIVCFLNNLFYIKYLGLISSSITLLATSILFFFFDKSTNDLMLNSGNLFEQLGVAEIFNFFIFDSFSFIFLILSALIFPSIFLYNFEFVKFSSKFHTQLLLSIQFFITISFLTGNLLVFYFMFEAIIFPMFLLIGIWGSRSRKIHAAYQFFFFTVISSILIILAIILTYKNFGTLYFRDFYFIEINESDQYLISILFFFGFMAKIPSLPVHIWLPEAHVEAPTIGSVILAAILLKFGFYGIIRTVIPICSSKVIYDLSPLFLTFFSISAVYGSIMAVRQIDLKKIIAYSSVAHMNFAMLGLFTLSKTGIIGSTFLMFSHGLISGSMFLCIGFLYERFHNRNLMYYGGLVQFMPIFSSIFFFIMFSNMSLPGTCNFVGEFLVFLSLVNSGNFLLFFSLLTVLLVAIFCLVILTKTIFYQITGSLNNNLVDLSFIEFFLIIFFVFYIVLFGIFPNFLIKCIIV